MRWSGKRILLGLDKHLVGEIKMKNYNSQLDQVAKVERMRAAILEGLQPNFAHLPLVAIPPRQTIPHPRFRGGALGGPPILNIAPSGHPLNLRQNNQQPSPNRGRGRGGGGNCYSRVISFRAKSLIIKIVSGRSQCSGY